MILRLTYFANGLVKGYMVEADDKLKSVTVM